MGASRRKAVLALADGRVFVGHAFGAEAEKVGEVVFNTSMAGTQEVLTDPTYAHQIVAFTYPEQGNVGTNDEDLSSPTVHASGVVVKHAALGPSNYRSQAPLQRFLEEHGIPGIEGIDTRALVRHIRDNGAMMGVLSTVQGVDADALIEKARKAANLDGQDLVTGVSTRAPYEYLPGLRDPLVPGAPREASEPRFHVVAWDFGVRRPLLQSLTEVGCRVTVVPAGSTARDVLALHPDGVFLTNGPGDPAGVPGAVVEAIAGVVGKVPVFGVGMGAQLLARALGASISRLPAARRGANQPVRLVADGSVEITAQHQGFTVDRESLLGAGATVTHESLHDGTVEGFEVADRQAFGVLFHPVSGTEPFRRFLSLMEERPPQGAATLS